MAAHRHQVAITKRKADHNSWKIFFDRKFSKMGENNSEDPLTDLNDARERTQETSLKCLLIFNLFIIFMRKNENKDMKT